MKKLIIILISVVAIGLTGCDDGKVNFFTVDQDIEFGRQLDSAILANPEQFPILDRDLYPEPYEHLDRIFNSIIETSKIRYKDRFPWEVKIINSDVLNAFAAPGGYLYFYTGLIHYLDNEAQFAGVVAHEIAHSDRRHSTQMLTKHYTFSVLISILLGDNPTLLAEIAANLALGLGQLSYSRSNEYEADDYAVQYMYETDYHARELAGFFEKLDESTQAGRPPEFLSTHPSPENRIEAIEAAWQRLGGKNGELFIDRYQQFKNSLPALAQ
jgi:beta-barrel assembly-enhancing protease